MATKVSPKVADEKRNQENVEVLDVRTEEEVAEGIIPNAIHLPLNLVEDKMGQLDKTKEYITVCASGKRGEKAADILNEHGFNAKTLQGGMQEWDGEINQ